MDKFGESGSPGADWRRWEFLVLVGGKKEKSSHRGHGGGAPEFTEK